MESKLTSAPTEAKKSKGMKISALARCKGSCFLFSVFFFGGGGGGLGGVGYSEYGHDQ